MRNKIQCEPEICGYSGPLNIAVESCSDSKLVTGWDSTWALLTTRTRVNDRPLYFCQAPLRGDQ